MEPDRNRTYRPPDESGAPPLSYGSFTKDAGTMPRCSSDSNQENGLALVRGLVEPVRLGSLLLISTTPIRYTMGHGQALEAVAQAKRRRGYRDL